jgi:hypothetical protein
VKPNERTTVFTRKSQDKAHPLDTVISQAITELEGSDSSSEKYTEMVAALKTLVELRNSDKEAAKKPSISPDAVASIVANLLGIGLILGFEKANVITTKGMSFVPKINV